MSNNAADRNRDTGNSGTGSESQNEAVAALATATAGMAIQNSDVTHDDPAILAGGSSAVDPVAMEAGAVTMGTGAMEADEFDHLEKAAEDLMATWTAEEDEKVQIMSIISILIIFGCHGYKLVSMEMGLARCFSCPSLTFLPSLVQIVP